jgi:imidazolonepropionase-like amidohydrolase
VKSAIWMLTLALLAASAAAAPQDATTTTTGTPLPIPTPSTEVTASLVALTGARVVTMAGHTYRNGTILIEKDKIVQVGDTDLEIPSRYQVVDLKGMEVYPGFIDTNTQVGLIEVSLEEGTRDADEDTDPITPHVRVVDGINIRSEIIPVTRVNGITTVLVNPGESNLFAGQSAVIDLAGESVPEMVVKAPAFTHLNLGEDPRARGRARSKFSTRMGIMASVRETLVKAQEYAAHVDRHKKELEIFEEEQKEEEAKDEKADKKEPEKKETDKTDKKDSEKTADKEKDKADKEEKDSKKKKKKKLPPEPPARDLKLESLVPALKRELPIYVRAHREDDIRNALELAREFKLKVVLSHATEGWRLAADIAAAGVPASVGPINVQPENWETLGARYENAALLAHAGVRIAIQTWEVHNVRNLPYSAGLAVAYGLGRDEALESITINAARLLGIDDRYGSIEKGKVANLVVSDGDPLQPNTHIRRLFIRGREISLKSRQTKLLEKYRSN